MNFVEQMLVGYYLIKHFWKVHTLLISLNSLNATFHAIMLLIQKMSCTKTLVMQAS